MSHADSKKKPHRPFWLDVTTEQHAPSLLLRYGVATICVAVVFMIRYMLQPWMEGQSPFIIFVPAIIFLAWHAGLGPALLASLASLLLANYFFIYPFHSWSLIDLGQLLALFTFLFTTFVVVALVHALRCEQSRVAAEAAAHHERAERLQPELEHRQRAEKRLQEREEQLDLIFRNAHGIAYITLESGGRIEDWNEGAERLFGYSRGEVLGRPGDLLFLPDDRARGEAVEELKRAAQKNLTPSERWHLTKSGDRVLTACVTCARHDPHGNVSGYLKIMRDLSERARAEEALRQSEERYRAIFEHADTGLVQVDPSGHILQANPKFCELLGYSLAELQQRTLVDVTYLEDRDRDRQDLTRLVSGEWSLCQREKRFVHKSGQLVWARTKSCFLRDSSGNPLSNIDVIEETGKAREAEEKLRLSEQRLRLATESANLGLWLWDVTSGTQEWSPIVYQHFGLPADLKPGFETFYACLHPEDRKRIELNCEHAAKTGELCDMEFRVVLPDASVRWISGKGRTISDPSDHQLRFFGITEDITARKRSEETLRTIDQRLRERSSQSKANAEERTSRQWA